MCLLDDDTSLSFFEAEFLVPVTSAYFRPPGISPSPFPARGFSFVKYASVCCVFRGNPQEKQTQVLVFSPLPPVFPLLPPPSTLADWGGGQNVEVTGMPLQI